MEELKKNIKIKIKMSQKYNYVIVMVKKKKRTEHLQELINKNFLKLFKKI